MAKKINKSGQSIKTMKVSRNLISSLALTLTLTLTLSAQTFQIQGDKFILNGKPFLIHSGEMHYPRIPEAYWKDRLLKAKAMGLNTVCTYIFWNLHETTPGHFDFTGNLDIKKFIKTAQEVGLYVIVRPGPYICAETDMGGLPSWLLKNQKIKLRSSDTNLF